MYKPNFGASPSGKAADFDSAIRKFESFRPSNPKNLPIMTVKIQFIRGVNEPIIPEIRLTKSNNASTGTAIFSI